MKHKGCQVCSHRGRRDLATIDLSGMTDDIYKMVCLAAKLQGMTYQQFMRHAISAMIDRIERGEDVGAYTLVRDQAQEDERPQPE